MKNQEVKIINPEDAPAKGRPTLFQGIYKELAYKLALLGYTNRELAESLGVSLTTFKSWLKQFPDFLTAVKAGKEIADAQVAEGLYKRATGYEYQSEKLFLTKEGEVIRENIIVHIPPDPGAAMNWLKNRQPELWSDKMKHELSGEIELTMNLG